MKKPIKQKGFTLTEIMIVVTLIGIITAIAVPQYKNSVRKGRRSDAQQLLLDISSKQEQYILDARTYVNNASTLGISKDGWTCTTGCSNPFYTVAVTFNMGPPPRYTIKATAIGDQTPDGDLILQSDGTRTGNW